MRENNFAYIGEFSEGINFPLENLLPPVFHEAFQTWVAENQLEKDFLIDPISSNPFLQVMLAKEGNKILAARSNPINWLMTEVACSENCRELIRTCINKLLIHRKDGQSLEDTIKHIYKTRCTGCGELIQAEGFVWEKGSDQPVARVYTCPHCGDAGEREISELDIEQLEGLGNLDIHFVRAMQKVNPEQEYEKKTIEEALACYIPRALYACMLLVNRSTALDLEKENRKFLQAALLTVFNDGHALRHWPPRDYRFLQFSVPPRYFEKNLYLSLAQAYQQWPDTKKNIPISYWPNLPKEGGGICFFQANLAEKKKLFESIRDANIITIFPRPGQTYWTLSAIWAGWLWGKNAVKPIRSALRRRRYGWYWYAKAINQAAQRIGSSPSGSPRIFGILPFYTPNLAYGLFAGIHCAGYTLRGAAFREKMNTFQAEWSFRDKGEHNHKTEQSIPDMVAHCLKDINEPLDFQEILMHIVTQSWIENHPVDTIGNLKDDMFSVMNERLKYLAGKPGLLISAETTGTQQSKQYVLYQRDGDLTPISEKVEMWILKILQQANEITLGSVDRLACKHFSGYNTPPRDLIEIILDAYAEKTSDTIKTYQLRDKESPQAREEDIREIKDLLHSIGNLLGFTQENIDVLVWKDKNTKAVAYEFHISCSADLSNTLLATDQHENAQHVFIYPGSRAGLIHYRLQTDFRLDEALREGWHLVKFRHIRRLAERELITLDVWKDLLDRDPPMREAPTQLQIL